MDLEIKLHQQAVYVEHADQGWDGAEHGQRLPRVGVVLGQPPDLRRRLLPLLLLLLELQQLHHLAQLLERFHLPPRLPLAGAARGGGGGVGVLGVVVGGGLEQLRQAPTGSPQLPRWKRALLLRRHGAVPAGGAAAHGVEEEAAEGGGGEGCPRAVGSRVVGSPALDHFPAIGEATLECWGRWRRVGLGREKKGGLSDEEEEAESIKYGNYSCNLLSYSTIVLYCILYLYMIVYIYTIILHNNENGCAPQLLLY